MNSDKKEEDQPQLGLHLKNWLIENNLQKHHDLLVKYGVINDKILQFAYQDEKSLRQLIDEMNPRDQATFLNCLRVRFGKYKGHTVNLLFIERAHAKIKQMENAMQDIETNIRNGQKYINNINQFGEYLVGLNENVESLLDTLITMQKDTNNIFEKLQGIFFCSMMHHCILSVDHYILV